MTFPSWTWLASYRTIWTELSHKSRSGELADKFPQNAASRAVMIEFADCFNRGQYFEAHEVLERLWLPQRRGPDGPFFKGLIQFAGAFVHVQKARTVPAIALLKLADGNLAEYPDSHLGVPVTAVRTMIAHWLSAIGAATEAGREMLERQAPTLRLIDEG